MLTLSLFIEYILPSGKQGGLDVKPVERFNRRNITEGMSYFANKTFLWTNMPWEIITIAPCSCSQLTSSLLRCHGTMAPWHAFSSFSLLSEWALTFLCNVMLMKMHTEVKLVHFQGGQGAHQMGTNALTSVSRVRSCLLFTKTPFTQSHTYCHHYHCQMELTQ